MLRDNLHLEEQYFEVLKSKTDAGVRIVPIADVIVPLFKHFLDKCNSKYVITTPNGYKVDYAQWWRYMNSVLETLKMQHTIAMEILSGCFRSILDYGMPIRLS